MTFAAARTTSTRPGPELLPYVGRVFLLIALLLAKSWLPSASAVSVQPIYDFGEQSGSSVLQNPDGSFALFYMLPASALLRVGADGTATPVYNGPTTYNPPRLHGPLLLATDGNYYGTISNAYSIESGGLSLGGIFRLTPGGQLSFVHDFKFDEEAGSPLPGLVQGPDGALYGLGDGTFVSPHGTVFRCALDGTVTTLHNFAEAEGMLSNSLDARLTLGRDGNFYGATSTVLFQVTSAGVFTKLHRLEPAEGYWINAGFTQDAAGNFYGTAGSGGVADRNGHTGGTVFRFTTAGEFTLLHTFARGTDGGRPFGSLVAAADGKFYGVTAEGGTEYGGGTLFSVDPSGEVEVVYRAYQQGRLPVSSLVAGQDGNLYATTYHELVRVDLRSPGTLVFNNDDFTASPNAGSAFITVSRVDGAAGSASVAYSTVDGTAHAGTDYTATSGVLTWKDGETAVKNFRVPLTSHGQINGSSLEFGVQLSVPTKGAVLGYPSTATVRLSGLSGLFQTQAGMAPVFVFSRGLDGDLVQRVYEGMDGNLYGAVSQYTEGGRGGTFQLQPSGDLTILASHNFLEEGGLTQGTDGRFYGTAAPNNAEEADFFSFAPGETPSVRCSLGLFDRNASGRRTLLQSRDGQFYGTLQETAGLQTTERVFRINPDGTQTTLQTINDGEDITLTEGADANLYGLVHQGGQRGAGYLFRLTPAGEFTRLHDFNPDNAGPGTPMGPLLLDHDGNLYGLTKDGGTGKAGTFYQLRSRANGKIKLKILHHFDPYTEGYAPQGDLLLGGDGNFYGTLDAAPNGSTFYRLSTTGALAVLYHGAQYDRALRLLCQSHDQAFYFATADADPSEILRFDPNTVGKTTVQISAFTGADFLRPGEETFLRLTRSGNLSESLTIRFTVKGTALPDVHYKSLPQSITFLPGHFDATLKVQTLKTAILPGQLKLQIKLRPSTEGNYLLTPGLSKAKVIIVPF